MSVGDWIAFGSAIISLVSLCATISYAAKAARASQQADARASEANTYAKRANDIAEGQAENELRDAIRQTRMRFEDISAELEALFNGRTNVDELTDVERVQATNIKRRFSSAAEDYCNAYHQACAKYLDDKIDKKRFKKDYITEIPRLINDKAHVFHDGLLHPESTSKYKTIWRVYHEWTNLEIQD